MSPRREFFGTPSTEGVDTGASGTATIPPAVLSTPVVAAIIAAAKPKPVDTGKASQ